MSLGAKERHLTGWLRNDLVENGFNLTATELEVLGYIEIWLDGRSMYSG